SPSIADFPSVGNSPRIFLSSSPRRIPMPRFKDAQYEQGKFIPIQFSAQILPGTFEHALAYVVDHKLDLSVFDRHFNNDDTGAPAYDPAVPLKIVLFAYSRGILSSRAIEHACQHHILFMAL